MFGWVISASLKTSKEIDDEVDHDQDHDDEEEDEHDDEVDALPPWEFMGVASQGGKTRVGRVRLRPNRGFPRCLARNVTPYKLVDLLTKEFLRVASQGRFTRNAPGLVGRSSV